MSFEDWDDLPWWKQRVYIEGYRAQGILTDSEDPGWDAGSVDDQDRETAAASVEIDPIGASDDDYRAMGLTVVT